MVEGEMGAGYVKIAGIVAGYFLNAFLCKQIKREMTNFLINGYWWRHLQLEKS